MEQISSSDPFAQETSSGTARFVGGTEAVAAAYGLSLDNYAGGGVGGGATSSAAAAAAAAAAVAASCSNIAVVNATHEFMTIKPGNGQKLPTGNARSEIPHSELVKMLYYLEGELQARDVVIAALRNDRVKNLITQLRTKRVQPNDPHAAIFRDKVTLNGNLISREASTQAAQAEMEVRQIIEQQMEQQYQMVSKQRATHVRMVNILTESLENNQRMLQELEEEKRKHENNTSQGDEITNGLEMERTKLKQELEEERTQAKKMEKDMKKLQETLDFERNRQKQIVLLLIAERKKILMKYIEEGKRSEDLAQILAEEKQRSDTIAEGLEEESKKSLRMEEELEKQTVAIDNERKNFLANLAKEEIRVKELEQEIATLRAENESLKKHQQQQQQSNTAGTSGTATVLNAAKARTFGDETCATPMVNIAKIVQPTATVSSVPVSGPTTGIARSIAPGQNIRCGVAIGAVATPLQSTAAAASTTIINTNIINPAQLNNNENPAVVPIVSAIAGASIVTAAIPPSPSPSKMQPTATIQRAPGGKYAAIAAATSLDQTAAPHSPHPVPIAVPPVTVPPASARGAPPPIPTKPIVPPKREPSLSRIGSISGGAAVAAAAVVANANAAAAANTASIIGATAASSSSSVTAAANITALTASAANISANVKLN